jgi:hypothetical protein
MSAVGMEDGAERRGMVRYEELICEGEKPLTTLVVLLSEIPLDVAAEDSEMLGEQGDALSGADVMICGADSVTCCDSGVLSAKGAR